VEMTPNTDDYDYSPDELLKIQESTEVMLIYTFEDDKIYQIRIIHPLHMKASSLIGNCIM
jgi:hypothetical protein